MWLRMLSCNFVWASANRNKHEPLLYLILNTCYYMYLLYCSTTFTCQLELYTFSNIPQQGPKLFIVYTAVGFFRNSVCSSVTLCKQKMLTQCWFNAGPVIRRWPKRRTIDFMCLYDLQCIYMKSFPKAVFHARSTDVYIWPWSNLKTTSGNIFLWLLDDLYHVYRVGPTIIYLSWYICNIVIFLFLFLPVVCSNLPLTTKLVNHIKYIHTMVLTPHKN